MPIKTGNFIARSSVGTQNITGVGFTPTWVIITGGGGQDAGPTTAQRTFFYSLGASDGTNNRAYGVWSQNNVGTSETDRLVHNDRLYLRVGSTGLIAEARLLAFTADGFDIDWLTGEGSNVFLQYVAGTGNVAVGSIGFATSGGSTVVTGFRPAGGLIFAHSANTLLNTLTPASRTAMGAFDASLNQWASHTGSDDAQSISQTFRRQNVAGTPASVTTQSSSTSVGFDFRVSAINANGFSVLPNVSPSSDRTAFYVVFDEDDFEFTAGNDRHNSDTQGTGSKSYTGVGFAPDFVGTWDIQYGTDETLNAISVHNQSFYNGVDPAEGTYGLDNDNLGTTACRMLHGHSKAFHADDGFGITTVSATWTSLDADGFTVNFTDTDAIQRRFGYWALRLKTPAPAQIHVGSFTGNGTSSQNVPTPFKADWVFFFSQYYSNEAVLDTVDPILLHYGASDGLRNRGSIYHSQNVTGASNPNVNRSSTESYALQRLNTPGSATASAGRVTGFTDTDIQIAWDDTDGARVHFIAGRGGQVKVGSIRLPTSGNAVVDDLGFRPKGLLFFHCDNTGNLGSITGAGLASWGAADGTNQWAMHMVALNLTTPTVAKRYGTNDSCIVRHNTTNITCEFALSSLDANGFTLAPTPGGSPSSENTAFYIAFGQGYDIQVGLDQSHSDVEGAGPQIIPVSFPPIGVLEVDNQNNVLDAITNQAITSIAAHDGATTKGLWVYDRDDRSTTGRNFTSGEHSEFIFHHGGTSVAAQANIELKSGSFELTYTDTDTARRDFGWIAFGAQFTNTSKNATLVGMDETHAITDGPRIDAAIHDWDSGSSTLVLEQAARAVRTSSGGSAGQARTTLDLTGQIYAEFEVLAIAGAPSGSGIGVVVNTHTFGILNYFWVEDAVNNAAYLIGGGYGGAASGSHTVPAVGNIVQLAFDASTRELWFGLNNTWDGVPGVSGAVVTMPAGTYRLAVATGQTAVEYLGNFGQRPFVYTPPAGFGGSGNYP